MKAFIKARVVASSWSLLAQGQIPQWQIGEKVTLMSGTPLVVNNVTVDDGKTSRNYEIVGVRDDSVQIAAGTLQGWVPSHAVIPVFPRSGETASTVTQTASSTPIKSEQRASFEKVAGIAGSFFGAGSGESSSTDSAPAVLPEDSLDEKLATWQAYLQRARIRWKAGDALSALADCDSAIKLEPNAEDVYQAKISILHEYSDHEAAIGAVEAAAKRFPKNQSKYAKLLAQGYYLRAIGFYKRDELQKALADLNESIKLDPNGGEAFFWRSTVFTSLQRFEEARKDLVVAKRLIPGDKRVWVLGGKLSLETGNSWGHSTVIDDFERALEIDPLDVEANIGLATVLTETNQEILRDGPRAIQLATRVCKETQWSDVTAISVLAKAYSVSNKADQAIRYQLLANERLYEDVNRSSIGARQLEEYQKQKEREDKETTVSNSRYFVRKHFPLGQLRVLFERRQYTIKNDPEPHGTLTALAHWSFFGD